MATLIQYEEKVREAQRTYNNVFSLYKELEKVDPVEAKSQLINVVFIHSNLINAELGLLRFKTEMERAEYMNAIDLLKAQVNQLKTRLDLLEGETPLEHAEDILTFDRFLEMLNAGEIASFDKVGVQIPGTTNTKHLVTTITGRQFYVTMQYSPVTNKVYPPQ